MIESVRWPSSVVRGMRANFRGPTQPGGIVSHLFFPPQGQNTRGTRRRTKSQRARSTERRTSKQNGATRDRPHGRRIHDYLLFVLVCAERHLRASRGRFEQTARDRLDVAPLRHSSQPTDRIERVQNAFFPFNFSSLIANGYSR